jgi:hypothetical protein
MYCSDSVSRPPASSWEHAIRVGERLLVVLPAHRPGARAQQQRVDVVGLDLEDLARDRDAALGVLGQELELRQLEARLHLPLGALHRLAQRELGEAHLAAATERRAVPVLGLGVVGVAVERRAGELERPGVVALELERARLGQGIAGTAGRGEQGECGGEEERGGARAGRDRGVEHGSGA